MNTSELGTLRHQLAAAEGQRDALIAGKRAALGDPKTFATFESELQTLETEIRRLSELVALHEADEANERAREAQEKLHANAAIVRKHNEKLAKKEHEFLQKIWAMAKPLLRELAEAKLADDELNRRLPPGERIVSADVIARTRRALPRVDLKSEPIMIWTFVKNGAPVGDPSQVIVPSLDKPNEGYIPSAAKFAGNGQYTFPCVRRPYRKISFHPAVPQEFPTQSLASLLRLPDFCGPGWLWNGDLISFDNPQEVLNLLNAPEPRRPVHEEMVPDDEDTDLEDAAAEPPSAADGDAEFDHAED